MTDTEVLALFVRAVESPHGIAVQCSDAEMFRKKCYMVRAAARKEGVSKYDTLSFRRRANTQEVWITKTGAGDGKAN